MTNKTKHRIQGEEIGARLALARESRGYSSARQAALSEGWEYGTYQKHENGERHAGRSIQIYAKAYDVRVEWLLTGKGSPKDVAWSRITDVPILSYVNHDGEDYGEHGAIACADLPPGDFVAYKVTSDEMNLISPTDSIVIVDRSDKALVSGGMYVYLDEDDRLAYRRFRKDPDRMEPVSTNVRHETRYPRIQPIIIGRVKLSILRMPSASGAI